jgi:hypothetical protein
MKGIALVAIITGIGLFSYSGVIWNSYLHSLPRMADIKMQRVYPLNIHGIVVFQTANERNWLWLFDRGGIALLFLGLAMGGLSEKMDGKPFRGDGWSRLGS